MLPLIKEIPYSLSPVKLFQSFQDRPHSVILDSAYPLQGLSNYSYVAADPFMLFSSQENKTIIERGSSKNISQENPFDLFRKEIGQFSTEPPSDLTGPFNGGAIGYFSYELRNFTEKLPSKNPREFDLPQAYFGFYDTLFCFNHQKRKAWIIASGMPETTEQSRQKRARSRIQDFEKIIKKSQEKDFPPTRVLKNPVIHSNFSKKEYLKAVLKAKEYIREGDIFQVNLCQRFKSDIPIPSFDLYKRLRRINPAPFAAFINMGDFQIASASPERFLRISGSDVETRPIKGTRPRGSTLLQDQMNAVELMESEKDRAELMMIVDLERNDLGRVCEPGTVITAETPVLESHPTVFHLVGQVKGKLRKEVDHVACIRAGFPGGSITGAPKIRAMEIIDELEPSRREIYTGALGYIGFNRQTDLNIVIRTMLIHKDTVYFHAGGGIVADSDPEMEYQETLDKAHALIESISKSSNVEYSI
jgi:para-aminobenzoate synthetase component 1